MKFLMTLVAVVMACLTMQLAQAAPAGTIILASGDVVVRGASGVSRPAVMGMTVESGDTLATQEGRAQIKFLDGGLISLQPATEFKITDFRFQDKSKESDSAVFYLIKGGLRAITGLIGKIDKTAFGKRNTEAYLLNTAGATIGIRGTEFKVLLCESSCKEPDGLYVHTGEGVIFVRNAMGEIDVAKGETAYVASPDTVPQKISTTPAMSAEAVKTTPCKLCSSTTAADSSTTPPVIAGVGTSSGFQPGTILSTNSLGNLVPVTSGVIAVARSNSAVSFTSTTTGLTYTYPGGVGNGAGSSAGQTLPSGGVVGTYINGSAVQGFVVSYNGPTNNGIQSGIGSIVADSVLNAGSDGVLYWGRWSGTPVRIYAGLNGIYASETFTLPGDANLHYLLGASVPTIPGTGTATYNFIGGTPSTDTSGAAGLGITSGTLTANFGANTVGAAMTVNHFGVYTLTATMPFNPSRLGTFTSDPLWGGSAGTTGAGVYTAKVEGFFGGTNAPTAPSHAGISYTINALTPIAGIGAFHCNTGC